MANVAEAAAAAAVGAMEDPHLPTSPSSVSSLSSSSSSDLDTESTGSFFPDRSTSLGMLMGVDLSSRRRDRPRPPATSAAATASDGGGRAGATGRRRSGGRGRRWWQLCREEDMARRTSLGDFLRVERRLGPTTAFYGTGPVAEHEAVGGVPLFAHGRVLPPAAPPRPPPQRAAKLPVLLVGICSGGEG